MALILSLLSAGVGHIYCGRIVKGLAIFSAWARVSLLCVTTALLPAEQLWEIAAQTPGPVYHEENSGRRYRIMLGDPPDAEEAHKNSAATVVPPRSVFVLGDNSRDSRQFGIHAGHILGYPQYLDYPAFTWSRFGVCGD